MTNSEAVKILKHMFWFDDSTHTAIEMAIRALVQQESIHPTGKWIKHPQGKMSLYECSKCGIWTDNDSDFCPNCGVKMAESEDEK